MTQVKVQEIFLCFLEILESTWTGHIPLRTNYEIKKKKLSVGLIKKNSLNVLNAR